MPGVSHHQGITVRKMTYSQAISPVTLLRPQLTARPRAVRNVNHFLCRKMEWCSARFRRRKFAIESSASLSKKQDAVTGKVALLKREITEERERR